MVYYIIILCCIIVYHKYNTQLINHVISHVLGLEALRSSIARAISQTFGKERHSWQSEVVHSYVFSTSNPLMFSISPSLYISIDLCVYLALSLSLYIYIHIYIYIYIYI